MGTHQFAWVPIRTDSTADVLDDLRRIVHALRRSSRSAEQTLGVTGAQLFVLKTLSDSPSLSLNALAAATHTHQSTVSVVVKRLVERGLVRRRTAEDDARRIELEATARGRALLAKAPSAAQERLVDALASMPAAQRKGLAAGLRALTTRMELDEAAPTMFFEEAPRGRGGRRAG
jgi:DNA-binding MarR family transcriptional regulator